MESYNSKRYKNVVLKKWKSLSLLPHKQKATGSIPEGDTEIFSDVWYRLFLKNSHQNSSSVEVREHK